MAGSNENRDRSRRSGADDQRWSSKSRILSGQTIGRSGDVVCCLDRAQGNKEHMFLGLTSKSRSTACQWFDIKPTRTGFSA
jgi:hypothetical protein